MRIESLEREKSHINAAAACKSDEMKLEAFLVKYTHNKWNLINQTQRN